MTFTYDGSFEGLLSAIFESFRIKAAAEEIVEESSFQPGLFGNPVFVPSNRAQSQRVKAGLSQRCGPKAVEMLYHAFLSEQPQVEMLIYRFVKLTVSSPENILDNFREPVVLQLHRIQKQIHREVHRMHAFVRFQQTEDGLFIALITPDFNVLPLLPPHFTERYPAFRWLIYDAKRKYGLYYEPHQYHFVTLSFAQQRTISEELLTTAEKDYQQLWQTYFRSVDIPERRNLKLHLQHVPKRYWKYLVEK